LISPYTTFDNSSGADVGRVTLKIEEPQDEAPPPEIMELKRQFPFELITLENAGAIIHH
jgi:hypothetical protein